MKEGHCKHEGNNRITFQLNSIYDRNINVKSYDIGLHENNLHNADDGRQAMGEDLRHIEMSRCIMHRGETEKSNQQHTRVMRWQAMQ